MAPNVAMHSPRPGGLPPFPPATGDFGEQSSRTDTPLEKENPILNGQESRPPPPRQPNMMPSSSGQTSSRSRKDSGGGFRFVVVGNPEELKDKKQMTETRKWVMNNYLDKERANPNTTDIRASGEAQAGKKRKLLNVTQTLSPGGPMQGPRPTSQHSEKPSMFGSSSERSSSVDVKSERDVESLKSSKLRFGPEEYSSSTDDGALVPGFPLPIHSAKGFNSGYLSTELSDVPFPPRPQGDSIQLGDPRQLGDHINPFDTWPGFENRRLDITDLKWRCAMRFGNRGMAMHWVPMLLKARHAFLSTICISSAHDDIMNRARLSHNARCKKGPSYERIQVRTEVISMINRSLDEPDMRVADSTIVAVLQLLMSEIMGCNDKNMRIHQQGLSQMIRQRGGLGRKGVDGHLARMLTVAMYILGVLRETPPTDAFATYGGQQHTKITEESGALPESPVCCKPTGYETIARVFQSKGPTFRLLDLLRILTNKFFDSHAFQTQSSQTPFRYARFFDESTDTLTGLYTEIFALPAGKDMSGFRTMHDRYVYESIRLTALVYSHAMARRLPLSVAAAEVRLLQSSAECVVPSDEPNGKLPSLSSSLPSAASTPTSYDYWPVRDDEENTIPLPIQIRNAIMQTETSSLWDHLAGVLFWVTLVAGAAANPGSTAQLKRNGPDEDARKWMAAVAVRCAIVLNFDYSDALLETVKRLMGIETVLKIEEVEESGVEVEPTRPKSEDGKPIFGPPEVMQTFSDFAHEFPGP